MSLLLEFTCHRPLDGFRVLRLDRNKWPVEKDGIVRPPDKPSDDEKYALERWYDWLFGAFDPYERRVVHLLVPRSPKRESYSLFDEAPALFSEFADVPLTIKGVIGFADRYGSLRQGPRPDDLPDDLDLWIKSIRKMRRAVDAWESAKETGDFKKIVSIIEHRGERRRGSLAGTQLNALLETDPSGAPRLCVRPSSFLEALWTQLTLAVEGDQNLRRCAVCTGWFPVESGRSDKEYCSVACRMRAYRKRKGVG
jgi:hypothetical protein